MKEKPNYYSILTANVRYDRNLEPNAKLLYSELTALCNKDGYCWASNEYLAWLYGFGTRTISRLINSLSQSGYIVVEIIQKDKKSRKIRLADIQLVRPVAKNGHSSESSSQTKTKAVAKNGVYNNTSINKKEIYKEKDYFEELKNNQGKQYSDLYENFIDIMYDQNGFGVGSVMTDILKLEMMTYKQFLILIDKMRELNRRPKKSKVFMVDMLHAMHNDSKYTKGKKSLYLTLNNWINMEMKR